MLGETRRIERHGLARDQGLVAAAAVGRIAQLLAGNAVGGVAVGTDKVQGFGHGVNL
ncbi:hypothetical protein D3C86_2119120 [compost metagenome]